MTRLTTNFTLEEFGKDLPREYANNYYLLCLFALEKVRERFGIVKITSGIRTQNDQLRLIAGGYRPSATSQHLTGEACDFVVHNTNLREVYNFLTQELKWPGQVELELGKYHIHIGLPRLGIAPNHFIREAEVLKA